MALSTDYAAAQLMYVSRTTNLTDDALAPDARARGNDLIRKLCAEYPSQADLLWLIYFSYWKLLDPHGKDPTLNRSQYAALLKVQEQWLKVLDHHGARNLSHVKTWINLTDLF